jgi:hypothetical protein
MIIHRLSPAYRGYNPHFIIMVQFAILPRIFLIDRPRRPPRPGQFGIPTQQLGFHGLESAAFRKFQRLHAGSRMLRHSGKKAHTNRHRHLTTASRDIAFGGRERKAVPGPSGQKIMEEQSPCW